MKRLQVSIHSAVGSLTYLHTQTKLDTCSPTLFNLSIRPTLSLTSWQVPFLPKLSDYKSTSAAINVPLNHCIIRYVRRRLRPSRGKRCLCLASHLDNKVNNGDIGGGHAESDTVQLALELGQHQGDGLGSSGGGGHNAEGSGPSTAQVAVRGVQQALVTGVRVGRGHGALDHTADNEGGRVDEEPDSQWPA